MGTWGSGWENVDGTTGFQSASLGGKFKSLATTLEVEFYSLIVSIVNEADAVTSSTLKG